MFGKMLPAFLFLFACFGIVHSVEFLSPSDIKPGMKGYGLTVFRGWEPERFDVEIIDVMKNLSPKGSIILARVKGGILEESGVIAGMSGSPVYIDGKLIGAVALAWPFAKEPVCGITPIGEMLAEKINETESAGMDSAGMNSGNADRMKKIRTPVFLSGFSGEAMDFVSGLFKTDDGSSFLLTGGNGENPSVRSGSGTPLKAGDAVAINLVDGDFSVQGIGTVTYVSNKDVFIFGHPMDLAGVTSLPISRSYIYSVIPSSQISFKLGASSEPLGIARYDGQHAVYCTLEDKRTDAMIPVSLQVIKAGTERAEYDYRFRVADNKNYFPGLTTGAISSAFMNHAGGIDDKRITLEFEIQMTARGKSLTVKNRFLYALNPSYFSLYAMLGDLSQYLSVFYGNPYDEVRLEKLNVKVTVEQDMRYYTLETLSVDKPNYFPGETVRCKVRLREYRGGFGTRELLIPIPEDAAAGSYWVLVGSETTFYGEVGKMFPKYFAVTSLDDLVRMANWSEDVSLLTVGLIAPRPGMVVRDRKMEKFPENYIPYFSRTIDKNSVPVFPDILMRQEPAGGAVFGSMRIGINIVNRSIQSAE